MVRDELSVVPRVEVAAGALPPIAQALPEVRSVPDVGRVTVLVPVVVRVNGKAPEVVKLPPRVIVFVPLFTPVPPFVPARMPETSAVKLTAP